MIDFAANILMKELQYISSKDILERGVPFDSVPLALLQQICFHTKMGMDETALLRKLHYLKDWVETGLFNEGWKIDAKPGERESAEGIGVFDLVHCFISKVLAGRQGKIVYRYKYQEIWHLVSGKLGVNLFAASAYARRDHEFFIQRKRFTDMDIASHDNHPLNEVLSRGMSDNHFHMRASAPYFILSWLSLMNSVTHNKVSVQLDQINEHPRNPKVRYRYQYEEDKFSILHLKAALIRVYLYAILTDQMIEIGEYDASVEWLLEYILEQEPIEKVFGKDNQFQQDIHCVQDAGCFEKGQTSRTVSIQQLWETQAEGMEERMKNDCPGFYWLFWECFPFVSLECINPDKKILCAENRRHIAAYIKSHYGPLSLSSCAWLFRGKNKDVYRREWEDKTNHVVRDMLKNPDKIQNARFPIQHVIDGFHMHSMGWHKDKDYALNSVRYDGSSWEQAVISGETWLIYEMERRRYFGYEEKKAQDAWVHQLFFAYLSIKESFRSELLQNNEQIGFHNFQAYQQRKDWFTTAFSEGELAQIAVRQAFRKQNLIRLECRIMPKDTDVENIRMLRVYDKAIGMYQKQDGYPYYYVFHFGKKQDTGEWGERGGFYCRHAAYRNDVRRKAQAILSMREKNPAVAYRLKGIDACSSEDGCRPEVFAVPFRVLKSHIVYQEESKCQLHQLRVSYHVGEENQDVLDGLRAINEAIYFFRMGSGDRLGHATMLGVDVKEWYAKNNNMISIRQQDYLDNVAWLYHQMIHYHVSNQDNLLEYLEHEFQRYFNLVYEKRMSNTYNIEILKEKDEQERINKDKDYQEQIRKKPYCVDDNRKSHQHRIFRTLDFNIHNYYYAWELRGDDPQLYIEGYYKKQRMLGSLWDDQKLNHSVESKKREIDEVAVLYHAYHYNKDVRREGSKAIVVKIPYYMVCGIELVQKKLQMEIAKKGIAIETNPTSNLMIGGLSGYQSHPIVSFYNKGLTLDQDQIYSCPQINVSINTDDPGVFTTSLYHEYSLMASALEQVKDVDVTQVYKKDMVYDWIDQIRKMGNSQSFDGNFSGEKK